MYRPMVLLLWAGTVLFEAACVKGDIVDPTLGADDSYSLADGPETTASGEVTFPFTVPSDAKFVFAGAMALTGFGVSSTANIADFRLAGDVSGAPGSLLESFRLVDALPLAEPDNSPVIVNVVLGPIVLAGKRYWLIAAPPLTGIDLDRRY